MNFEIFFLGMRRKAYKTQETQETWKTQGTQKAARFTKGYPVNRDQFWDRGSSSLRWLQLEQGLQGLSFHESFVVGTHCDGVALSPTRQEITLFML